MKRLTNFRVLPEKMKEGKALRVLLMRKQADRSPVPLDERNWTEEMIIALEHANYLKLNGREYEMLEGRLDVDSGTLELLVEEVADPT